MLDIFLLPFLPEKMRVKPKAPWWQKYRFVKDLVITPWDTCSWYPPFMWTWETVTFPGSSTEGNFPDTAIYIAQPFYFRYNAVISQSEKIIKFYSSPQLCLNTDVECPNHHYRDTAWKKLSMACVRTGIQKDPATREKGKKSQSLNISENLSLYNCNGIKQSTLSFKKDFSPMVLFINHRHSRSPFKNHQLYWVFFLRIINSGLIRHPKSFFCFPFH